jgi:hypothetical protein
MNNGIKSICKGNGKIMGMLRNVGGDKYRTTDDIEDENKDDYRSNLQ